jgi:hypothetical protein
LKATRPAPPVAGANDQIAQLEKLNNLRTSGVLTQDDCRKLKEMGLHACGARGGS